MILKRIIFLVGPTAAGKSEAALSLALKINAEIISCDSMQVYKTMDIITSKPPLNLRKKIPHHLIDCLSPEKEYNAAAYRAAALKKIKEVIGRGKAPLFTGGTGLYVSVLVDGIFESNPRDDKIRQDLYNEAACAGAGGLFEELKRVDPQSALKIHQNDIKRVIRALEVFRATGKPISQLQKNRVGLTNEYNVKMFCLNMARNELYERINKRVDKMFKLGLEAEVKRLLKLKLSKTASCAIGINELKGYFEGLYPLDEAKELIKKNTRNYAKRQLTWFRKDKRIAWIDADEKESPGSIAKKITCILKEG
jgi:tRNA dimethylallyltransferase